MEKRKEEKSNKRRKKCILIKKKTSNCLSTHLYENFESYNQNKQQKFIDNIHQIKQLSNTKFVCFESEKIVYLAKRSIFSKLFTILDFNEDNKIHYFNINFTIFPMDIKTKMNGLFELIKAEENAIDQEIFFEMCETWYTKVL